MIISGQEISKAALPEVIGCSELIVYRTTLVRSPFVGPEVGPFPVSLYLLLV